MDGGAELIALVAGAARELTLFAAVGVALGGLDDLVVDLLWLGRAFWRRYVIHTRHVPADSDTLAAPARPGWIAVFVPAWREAAVIGQMLANALDRFDHADYSIYVGCYPNDPETLAIVEAITQRDGRARLVVNPRPGPTTKADCLNRLWDALAADEARLGRRAKAVVLHDAEDVVHPAELRLFDLLVERFALVQIPVLPLVDRDSRWIAGSYLDEFAEAHGKSLVVRELIGAGVPSAGTGCAIAREVLALGAAMRGGAPFDADSLTEDYELGLRLREIGARGAFVRLPSRDGGIVAVRAYFPNTLTTAVRQKARWMIGIALSGWDRLGWAGGPAERWMRLRDRRALLSAVVLLAAYGALVLQAVLLVVLWLMRQPYPSFPTALQALLALNALLLVWRAAMRWAFVRQAYGWREGFRAVPRMVVSNIVAMMAARRAALGYLKMRRTGRVEWDKTTHHFPTAPALAE